MEKASRQDLEKQQLERGDGGRSVLGGGCNVGEATEARKPWTGHVRQRTRKLNNLEHRGQGCWFWNR